MEKEHYHHLLVNQCDGRGIPVIGAWNSSIPGMETPQGDLNSTLDQQQLTADCFFNSNWDPSSMDHNDPFKSALSSIVSSPVASAGTGNGLVIRELIGRLGSISNSGEVSPQSRNINNGGGGGSSNTPSYYCTPLNSPPKLHLSSGFNSNHSVRQGNSDAQSQLQFPGSYLHLPPSLSALNADPGFVDRAARLSAFGGGNVAAQFETEFGYISMLTKLETPGNLSRELYNQVVGAEEKKVDNNGTVHERTVGGRIASERSGDSREGSSVSELNPAGQSGGGRTVQNDTNSRKRKANGKSKGEGGPAAPNFREQKKKKKVGGGENDESPPPGAKRIKQDEDTKEKDKNINTVLNDDSKAKTGGDGDDDDIGDEKLKNSSSKESAKTAAEPPKDYIHVRARRGQATDSHSLAERVRREKISERMKFLQDLVPGCNKVTGKAVVLDEIINYVQSLQRQVEFLSMKLATVNPGLEFNIESLLSKDSFHSHNGSSLPPPAVLYPLLDSATHQTLALPYGIYTNGAPENPFSPSNPTFHRNPSIQMQPSVDGFNDAVETAFGSDDLHSIVQMGFYQQNHETMKGTKADTAMKVEL